MPHCPTHNYFDCTLKLKGLLCSTKLVEHFLNLLFAAINHGRLLYLYTCDVTVGKSGMAIAGPAGPCATLLPMAWSFDQHFGKHTPLHVHQQTLPYHKINIMLSV